MREVFIVEFVGKTWRMGKASPFFFETQDHAVKWASAALSQTGLPKTTLPITPYDRRCKAVRYGTPGFAEMFRVRMLTLTEPNA